MAMDKKGMLDAIEVIKLLDIKGEDWMRWHELLGAMVFDEDKEEERETFLRNWRAGDGTEQQRQLIALTEAVLVSMTQMWIARDSFPFHPTALVPLLLRAFIDCMRDVAKERYPVDKEKLTN